MTLHRVLCLSRKDPVASTQDVLTACHDFPSRNVQSGIGGKLLQFGEQYALLLEGGRDQVDRLVRRIQRNAPEFGMSVRFRADAEERAFTSWAISDLYRDEIELDDPAAAEELDDLLIDLLAGDADESADAFGGVAAILQGRAPTRKGSLVVAA